MDLENLQKEHFIELKRVKKPHEAIVKLVHLLPTILDDCEDKDAGWSKAKETRPG